MKAASWTTWPYDARTDEFVGPCGCRVPNTHEGLLSAKAHDHDGSSELGELL